MMELKGHWENTVENWTPIYDRLPFHLLSRYGQVLLGRRLLDGRYLLMGLVANFVGIVSIFFPHLVTQGIMLPLLSVAIGISGWFTVGGFVRKGSLDSRTAEGLLLGNFPIWTFGFWSIPLSLDDYYRNLSICQVEQFLGSSTVCTGARNALYLILLIGLSLAFALAVTLACLLTLRRLSARN